MAEKVLVTGGFGLVGSQTVRRLVADGHDVVATDLGTDAQRTAAEFDNLRGVRRGKVTLINFFASWCVPCRAEQPLLLDLAQDKSVEVDGIAWKNKPEDAAGFLAELGNPFAKVAIDQTGRTFIDFGAYGVPESYLIDRQGRIRFRQVGPLTQDVIDRQLKPMIAALAQSQTTTEQ